jgi:UDP-GlcNAc:undecaprenyl-phosphate GlcNAc-1-phosphate transferase
LRNQPIFTADRRHIHHRLLDRGFSARQAVWVLYLFAALAAALALLASSRLGGKLQIVVIVLFCLAAGIGIQQLRYWEFDIAGQFLFGGGLKRALDGRLRLERLTSELERAGDEKNWWAILVEGARSLGMLEIRWVGVDGERSETLAQTAPAWTFRVSLTDVEFIEVTGAVPDASSSFDLMGFAENARRSFQARRAAVQPETAVNAKS